MDLNNYFNAKAIKDMTFDKFVKTCKKACRTLGIDMAETYTILTGNKVEKPKDKVEKPKGKVEKKIV